MTSRVSDTQSSHLSKPSRYRPEIDGLRAFAVVAVIINHFNKDILPGGYLGVDIFFVISGYVITSSLFGRPSKDFKDFISGFYERRIKRLVPALSVFVLITSIAICLCNPSPGTSLQTGLTSLFGLSNLYLLQQSRDYFAQSTELNVFTHTWSLGVEEQFYIFFPFLIWFSGFGRQTKNGARNLLLIVGALTIASLIGFLYLYPTNQPAAYFLMSSRFWEMAAGCLIFIGFQKRASVEQLLEKVPPLLVVALIVGVMFLPMSMASASTAAVVALSSILIASLKKQTAAFKVFTHPRVVYIGLISYSLYLWHWCVLSITRWTIGIHWWSVPFQVVLMLGLAIASYRWIETPLRKGNWFGRRWKTLGVGGGILIIISLFLGIGRTLSSQIYLGRKDVQRIGMEPLDASFESRTRMTDCSTQLKSKVEDTIASCYKDSGEGALNTLIALVGDSMAKSLYKIIDIEDSKNRLSTFVSFRSACLVPQPPSSTNNCKQWSDKILDKVVILSKQHFSTILIINGYYQDYFRKSRSFFQPFLRTSNDFQGYLNEVDNLAKKIKRDGNNISLILTMPVPMQSFNPYPQCYKEWFRQSLPLYCESGTPVRFANMNPRNIRSEFEKIASNNSNVYIFDPSKSICANGICLARKSTDDWLYADDHHLSYKGANHVYPEYEIIKQIILEK